MTHDPVRNRIVRLIEGSAGRLTFKGASLAAGRNETYLQQFVRRGSPRRLPEDVREAVADYLGVDQAELRPDTPRPSTPRFDEDLVRNVAEVVLQVNESHGQRRSAVDLADTIARLCAFYFKESDRTDLALMRESIESVLCYEERPEILRRAGRSD